MVKNVRKYEITKIGIMWNLGWLIIALATLWLGAEVDLADWQITILFFILISPILLPFYHKIALKLHFERMISND